MNENKNGLLDENGNYKPLDNKYKNVYKKITAEDVEQFIKEQKDYWEETKLANGGIKIKAKVGNKTLNIIGGRGFAEQLDEAFDKAMKEEFKNNV